jgi:chromosome segregation ATPase
MSFAQALTEARQIIVQQSNRIKGDLDRIKAMQETLAAQTATIAEHERTIQEKTAEIGNLQGQVNDLTGQLDTTRIAKDQAEAVCDRQGQRLTQLQETITGLERQHAEHVERVAALQSELDGTKVQLPTSEDHEALAALSSLLAAKKGGSPSSAATAAA